MSHTASTLLTIEGIVQETYDSLRGLRGLCLSAVNKARKTLTAETQRARSWRREFT